VRRAEAQDTAWRIVLRRWDALERLADRLHERRVLDADEVAAVLGVAPPPSRRPTGGRSNAGSGAGRRTSPPPWLIATRSFTVGGHEVLPGARCLPGSPAHQSDPGAWRRMRPGEPEPLETRACATVAVR
jgi:hypothetical protein